MTIGGALAPAFLLISQRSFSFVVAQPDDAETRTKFSLRLLHAFQRKIGQTVIYSNISSPLGTNECGERSSLIPFSTANILIKGLMSFFGRALAQFSTSTRDRRAGWVAIGLTVAVLLPFLNKAFYVDDTLFIWIAKQIGRHPLDPYGFDINWSSFQQPMSVVMQNPPLCSYYIALVASIAGWSELALHIGFIFPAAAAIAGTFVFAGRFCARPLTAALLALFAPVFLVSATGVMCDVMLLALWVWALEFWFVGLEQQKQWSFAVSAAFIAAAALTKYFGIALLPLLGAYTITKQRRLGPPLGYLLIPVASMFAYNWLTERKYDRGLFSAALAASSTISSATKPSCISQTLIGLAFAGGCFIAALFFFRVGSKKLLTIAVAVFVALAIAFKFWVTSWVYLATSETPVWLEGGLFASAAIAIFGVVLIHLIRERNAETLLFCLWLVGTFVFATFLNWSITARTFLPMAPAVAILVTQHFEKRQAPMWLHACAILSVATLSLLITAADYGQANCGRAAARLFRQKYGSQPDKVQFMGHWGFQYYMEQWGAKPFDRNNPKVTNGDIIVGPWGDLNAKQVSAGPVAQRDELKFATIPFVSTSGGGASFYSSFGGPLPWIVNQISAERYFAVRTATK